MSMQRCACHGERDRKENLTVILPSEWLFLSPDAPVC